MQPKFTFRSIRARAVVLKLRRPIVARIMTITEWPLILIDLETEQGVTGRSYIGPYNTRIHQISHAGRSAISARCSRASRSRLRKCTSGRANRCT